MLRSNQTGEYVPSLGGQSGKGSQGTASSCCSGFFASHNSASPKPALLSVRSLAQEQLRLMHWSFPPRGVSVCPLGHLLLLLQRILCSTQPCPYPQVRPFVCRVHRPQGVPVPALRRSTQNVSDSIDWTKMPRLSWLHLKEEMGRRQCKNSSNNLKGSMTPPEPRDHPTRIEHPTPEEIEEINFKRNFMKIIKELKQDMKSCFDLHFPDR